MSTPKQTRQQLIDAGKIWHVTHPDKPDDILFEGCQTHAMSFIRQHFGNRAYKRGDIRLGEVIFEMPED